MTEEEAKTKACIGPVTCGAVQYASKGYEHVPSWGGINDIEEIKRRNAIRDATPPVIVSRLCVGSACMAWRDAAVPSPTTSRMRMTGYCGLAGKPE